MLIVTLY
ncbi:Protein of unknown function [Bacillus mycoides]|nr:Protein of unknown function [Bacillus mycoides]